MYTIQKAKAKLEREANPPVNLCANSKRIREELYWPNSNAYRYNTWLTNKAKFNISGTCLALSVLCGLCLCSQWPSG